MIKRLLLLFFAAAPVAAQTPISGNITGTRTLTVAESPYLVTSNLNVNAGASLTIERGVEVQFREHTTLVVTGSVTATGATFTSAKAPAERTRQDWGGITVNRAGSLTLTDSRVEFGGTHGGLIQVTGGQLDLVGTTVTQAHTQGVRVGGSATVAIRGGTSITATQWPIAYFSDADLTFEAPFTLTGNTHDAVLVSYTSVQGALTLGQTQVPYVYDRSLTVPSGTSLTVAAQTTHKFYDGTGLFVSGTFTVQPAAGQVTTFTEIRDDNAGGDTNADGAATAPGPQRWQGIVLRAGSDASHVSGALVRYAGQGGRGGITIESASPTVEASEFQFNRVGLVITGPAQPVLRDNTIGSSQEVPLAMTLDADPVLENNILSFRDNRYDAIGLLGGVPAADAVLRPRSFGRDDGTTISNITYVLYDDLVVPAGRSLTIRPGVVIKGDQWWKDLVVQGTLNATGTADSSIVFTSIHDDNHGQPRDTNRNGTQSSPNPRDWGGIVFEATATADSRLERALVRYGQASRTYDSAVMVYDSAPTIARVRFETTDHGVAVHGTATPRILECTFVNVLSTPVVMSLKSNPVFTETGYGPSGVDNVGLRALGIMGETVGLDVTLDKRAFAGYDNITYFLHHDLIVGQGATLTIPAGIVVKARHGDGGGLSNGLADLIVEGALRVLGTPAEPVVFTSLHDDGAGNPLDTEGNLNAVTPARNQWGVIRFTGTSDDAASLIEHARIRFGHRGLDFISASPTIRQVLLENGQHQGLYLDGDAAPVLRDVSITGFASDPIIMSLLSNPDLSGITFASNGSNAIRLHSGDLNQDATLRPLSASGFPVLAYVYQEIRVRPGVTLTLAPGTVMKAVEWWNRIDVRGALRAEGTAQAPIVFTHFCDDSVAGDTNNDGSGCQPSRGYQNYPVTFYSESDGAKNVLRHLQVRYAGGGTDEYCGVRFYSASAVVDHVRFEQIGTCALGIFDASSPTITNTEFSNVTGLPVYMSLFSAPTFGSGLTLSNVGNVGLGLRSETYTQDATVPVRSFAGYDNVTYFLHGRHTVAAGTHLTIPAGVVFKADDQQEGFLVSGRLTVAGTDAQPVVFTHVEDDRYGHPADSRQNGSAASPSRVGGAWLHFEDVSDDASAIEHAVFAYKTQGIRLQQAAPTVQRSLFDRLEWGLVMDGVATPAVLGNTFRDLAGTPLSVSAISYPRQTTGNAIEGTTLRAIHVREETLSQDATLVKRDFAGIRNIPYLFNNYTVGTSATLTFAPGVVAKFYPNAILRVNRGLIAEGGGHPDSTIVFTSLWDDFYGGDTNADSLNPQVNTYYRWGGMVFTNEALDASLRLKHVVIRHAGYTSSFGGLRLESASPTVSNVRFEHNMNGIMAYGASNPVVTDSDFERLEGWAIYNETGAFTIAAQNNWWGHASGPNHASNPGGTGSKVSDGVDFSPWVGGGAVKPVAGDVSMNGEVQPYDAALVLQHAVGNATLTAAQASLADVSGNGEATAMDAALILQYTVGLRNSFPIEVNRKAGDAVDGQMAGASPVLHLEGTGAGFGETVEVSLRLAQAAGTASVEGQIAFDPAHLALAGVEAAEDFTLSYAADSSAGSVRLALARAVPLESDAAVVRLVFRVHPGMRGQVETPVRLSSARANESAVAGAETRLMLEGRPEVLALRAPYPNPARHGATLRVDVPEVQTLRVAVYNLLGQQVQVLFDGEAEAGVLALQWDGAGDGGGSLASGLYLIRLEASGRVLTQPIHLVR